MVAAGEQLPKQHELAKRQYQSPIKFQCAQPPLLCMPMLFKPAFDTDKFAQYHPTTLDSNNSQVSLLSDDLGLPDLVNAVAYLPPDVWLPACVHAALQAFPGRSSSNVARVGSLLDNSQDVECPIVPLGPPRWVCAWLCHGGIRHTRRTLWAHERRAPQFSSYITENSA